MRSWVLILSGILAAAFPLAAGTREDAYADLRNEAHATKLIDQASADIKAHRYEAALKKADEALALQPGNAIALNARGAALTELRRFPEAEKALDAAVAADPKSFPQQFNQGELLALQKKYSDATVQFDVLQGRFGPLPILKYKIYLCYALNNQPDRAAEALANLRFPQDGAAWYFAQAADRLMAGKKSEANRYISAAEAIDDENAQTYRDTLVDAGLLK